MKILFQATAVTLSVLLTSCTARIPEPVAYPYTQQRKMQAIEHWQVLARDVANKINEQLVLTDHANNSVYVEYNCGSDSAPCKENETSPFNEAFRDLLITSLYDLRIPTESEKTNDALTIEFKVQIVHHKARRKRTLQPGIITTLTAAVAVLRNASTSLLLIGSGATADIANSSLTLHGHKEILITTTMIYHNEYFFRSSDIYYINDPDFWHYLENFPSAAPVKFSSKTLQQREDREQNGLIPKVSPIPQLPEKQQREKQTIEPMSENI